MIEFIIGFVIGWICQIWWSNFRLLRSLEAFRQEAAKQQPQEMLEVHIEKHGESLYVFRKDNHSFLCQGSDLKDIQLALTKIHPNVHITCHPDNMKEVGLR